MVRRILCLLLLTGTGVSAASEVALLRSDDFDAYNQTAEAVVAELGIPVAILDLEGIANEPMRSSAAFGRIPQRSSSPSGKRLPTPRMRAFVRFQSSMPRSKTPSAMGSQAST